MTQTIWMSPAGAGAKDGTSFANAYDDTVANWTTVAAAWDGDTTFKLSHGTYNSFTGDVTFSGTEGTASAYNVMESVDASTGASGDYTATLDLSGGHRLNSALDYSKFIGILFTNGGYNLYGAHDKSIFLRCGFTSATGGYWGTADDCLYENCYFNNNTGYGLYAYSFGNTFVNCKFRGNGSGGINGSAAGLLTKFIRCDISDNTGVGLSVTDGGLSAYGCVFDGNTSHGISVTAHMDLVAQCKFTNNGGYGVTYAGANIVIGAFRNYFYNNTSGEVNLNSLADTWEDSTSMSGDGYENQGTGDLRSATGDESIGVAQEIGQDYSIYESVFPPESSGGGVLFNNGLNGGLNG